MMVKDDGTTETVFLIGDTIHLCEAKSVKEGLLLLFSVYFMLNLNYPHKFAQMLGLLHVVCLKFDFPKQLRSATFDRLKESLEL